MKPVARVLAAVVTTAALTLTGQAVQTASAKPHPVGAHAKGGKSDVAKSDVRKVVRDVERKTRQLDRTVWASRIGMLAEEVQATVVANVEADKVALAAIAAAASAADSTVDLREVRRELRNVRVENYRLSVNVLRAAARLQESAAANPEAAALVDSAVAKALTVTAASPKSLVREARADLAAARGLLETETETDPIVEPTDPVIG